MNFLLKQYFTSELKRSLFGRNAIISFSITLAVLLLSFMNYFGFLNFHMEDIKYMMQISNIDALDAFLTIRSDSIIVIVFPLLATLIFSDSYLNERENGFTKYIYTRMSIKNTFGLKV